jgi:hypothetical protein
LTPASSLKRKVRVRTIPHGYILPSPRICNGSSCTS